MTQGIVTSLEILAIGIGNRGSKSDSLISVKEQRVDGFSISTRYCKVYSKCRGNSVFLHNSNNVMLNPKLCLNNFYSKTPGWADEVRLSDTPASLFSSQASFSKLNPHYVTGFTDGEGCFFVSISPNSKYKTKFRVKTTFQVGVHIKDIALLEKIKLFFNVGHISKLGLDSVQYRVSGINDLKVIINHFDEFSLLTYKQSDYLLFKEVVKLIEDGKHLTLEGLNRIASIKASLNSKELSDTFKLNFPDLVPALIPEVKYRKIQSLY